MPNLKLTLLTFGFLIGVGCSPSTIEANPKAVDETATSGVNGEPETSPDTPEGADGDLEEDDLDLAGASLDRPLAVGDASVSGFSYQDEFLGADWDGAVLGLVASTPMDYVEEEGACYLLLGTLTPTAIDEGSVTSGFQSPQVSVIAGGQQIQAEGGTCDGSLAKAAGYGWILEAEVTVGTTYPFYAEIFLPGDTSSEIESVVLGDPSGSEALYYEPTILDTPPTS